MQWSNEKWQKDKQRSTKHNTGNLGMSIRSQSKPHKKPGVKSSAPGGAATVPLVVLVLLQTDKPRMR